MVEVGIRELKAHLSGYVRRVHTEKATVAVTDRGRIVAVLAPPPTPEPGQPSLRERILARGGRPALDSGWPTALPPLPAEVRQVDAATLLDEARGAR